MLLISMLMLMIQILVLSSYAKLIRLEAIKEKESYKKVLQIDQKRE